MKKITQFTAVLKDGTKVVISPRQLNLLKLALYDLSESDYICSYITDYDLEDLIYKIDLVRHGGK